MTAAASREAPQADLRFLLRTGPHTHVMVDALSELVIADYGDAPVDPESAYRSVEPIRGLVREVAETGAVPFVVGGDHSLMYPDVAAISDIYGKGKVGVIHFDAHYDAGSSGLGHNLTHGTPVRRLIEQGRDVDDLPEVSLQPVHGHGAVDRVAAEAEEVVADADGNLGTEPDRLS